MKINIDGVDKINSDYIRKDLKRMKETESTVDTFASEDKVEISSKALDLKSMQKAAMNESDVRTDKVAKLKTEVDGGTYKINHERLAERLIEEHVIE